MKNTIFHIGLEVDDTQYHGSAIDNNTGEIIDFKCRPTLKRLLNQLQKIGKHYPETPGLAKNEPARAPRKINAYLLRTAHRPLFMPNTASAIAIAIDA